MLQAIHDKAKGWVAYAIVGFISIPFALWGINSYFEGGSAPPVAVVNGEEITSRDVQNELLQLRQRFGRMAAQLGDEQLQQMALDGLVNQSLLRQKAEEQGYRASSREVADAIVGNFQTEGKFDPEQLQRFLQFQRIDQATYENRLRDSLTLGQFRQAVSSSAFVPKSQAEYYQSLRNQKREVESFTLKVTDFEGQVQVGDEQVAEYYEQNKASFMTDERVKLAYLEVDQEKLAASVEVTDEILQDAFEENADRYLVPESRNTSHVLITIPEGEGKEEEAKAKAEKLYEAINSGQRTFEDVATKDSEDKVAAENNGIVGDVVRGDWDPEFENAVFALEENQISEPVKTGAGFEIIRVNSITKAEQKTFDQAREEVEEDYRRTEAERLYHDKTDEVQTIAYEQSGDLAPAAEASGLEVQTTDWVTRVKGDGVAANPKILEAAFSEEVLGQRKNSIPLELSDTQAVVIRVVEQEAAKQKPLDEVKADIVKQLTTQEARKLVAEKGEAVLAKLAESNDWSALSAESLGDPANVEKPGKIERVGSKLAPAVISKAFAIARPPQDKASWDSTVLANGDYVLIAVKTVEDGATELDETAGQLFNGAVSNREVTSMLEALRERAEIELMPENL